MKYIYIWNCDCRLTPPYVRCEADVRQSADCVCVTKRTNLPTKATSSSTSFLDKISALFSSLLAALSARSLITSVCISLSLYLVPLQ